MLRNLKIKPLFVFIGLLSALLFFSVRALAQSADSVWTLPINLSNSGSTSDPVGVMDEAGKLHVIWSDAISGYMYSGFDGTQWSEPEAVTFPFDPETTVVLRLVDDQEGRIHAFWIEELEDTKDLYYSSVDSEDFSTRESWNFRTRLGTDIAAVESTVDSQNRIHTLFVKSLDNEDQPAGVYYRRSTNGGSSWSTPQQFYASPYYRDLTHEQINLSMVSGLEGENNWVQAVWDNQLRELVMSNRSADNGETWGETEIVDGPISVPDTDTNFQIKLGANGQNLLRVWESGIPAEKCSHNFQSSSDGGTTWTPAAKFIADFTGCLGNIHFLPVNPDLTVMTFKHRSLPYLLAWDNSRWGEPILQTDLTELTDPETLNLVNLDCIQTGTFGETLTFVGCDENGNDIWSSSRTLTAGDEWFPAPPAWTVPVDIAKSPSAILDPNIIVDESDRIHIFWVQVVEQEGQADTSRIYYSRRESGAWSTPRIILSSPEGDALNPSVILDDENRLHIVWSQGEAGKLFYSWANADSAVSLSEWSQPVELPVPQDAAGLPMIFGDRQGRLFVIYAISLNDGRGVYLTRSGDGGSNWSEPIQIFNAEEAGWEMAGQPFLAEASSDELIASLTRSTLPGGAGITDLYSTKSGDHGDTWSEAENFVSGPILWSNLVSSSQQVIHRLWQQPVVDRSTFSHQKSIDSGIVWSDTSDFTGLVDLGPAGLTVDETGQLHLLQITQPSEEPPTLNHWIWDGTEWVPSDGANLRDTLINRVDSIAAHAGSSGLIGTVFVGERTSEIETEITVDSAVETTVENIVENILSYSERRIDLAERGPIIVPTLTITPPPTADPDVTPSPESTPTIDLSALRLENSPGDGFLSQLDVWVGTAIGIISAGLIVVAVFFIGLRRKRG